MKNLFTEIRAENFANKVKECNIQMSEAYRMPNSNNQKKGSP